MTAAITTLAILAALLFTAAGTSTTTTQSKGINPVQHSE